MKRKKHITTIAMLTACTAMCVCACTPTQQSESSTEDSQWETVSDAYCYTFPLVLMDMTMKVSTNTEEPDSAGHAPVNQLIHSKNLATADFKTVVTPNVDTVYTQAWLDLEEEPMVFVMPEADRFFQTQVLDAWTNTPAVLESGSYLIAKDGWDGDVPDGLTLIEVPTDMTWLISRILVNGSEDMEQVSNIQSEMQLMPLSAYENAEDYVPGKGEYSEEYDVNPLDAVLAMDIESYFSAANELMEKNPPADEDADILEEISALNIGAGMNFDVSVLKGDVEERWEEMISSVKSSWVASESEYQKALGDWTYYASPIGNFGTSYEYRALVAMCAIGANPVEVAIYAKTNNDSQGNELSGAKEYKLHFSSLPPVEDGGFWSVTAYGSDNYLIDNEIDRYCINDRSDFTLNEDGSLDIILSCNAPENQQNWIPVGEDEFHLYLRVYLPGEDILNGSWEAPTITPLN